MIFIFFVTGACAMALISLDWRDKIATLGWFGVLASAAALTAWLLLTRYVALRQPLGHGDHSSN